MIIDAVDMNDLGDTPEEAFLIFEGRLRESLIAAQRQDRNDFSDMNGNYNGSHAPERYYVSSMIAFLDEYELEEINVSDISDVIDIQFQSHFTSFFNKINYFRTRFSLKKSRSTTPLSGTPLCIAQSYKSEIHDLLGTIRKIVNQKIENQDKKDKIFKKIADLHSEIDRDRTTVDAVFSKALSLAETMNKMGEILEPAVQKFERVMTALNKGCQQMPLLSKSERPKLLEADSTASSEDDELPF